MGGGDEVMVRNRGREGLRRVNSTDGQNRRLKFRHVFCSVNTFAGWREGRWVGGKRD